MSVLAKREIPLLIVIIAVLVMFGEYILVPFKDVATAMRDSAVVIAGFALTMAAVTLTIHHGSVIKRVCCI
jgi:hypothetical protein